MLSFVKANGWVLVTRKMTKKCHNVREYVLSKEWLQKKRDISLRVLFDECFSCTLYEEDFSVNRFEMKQATCVFNLTNVGSSMCVKEHSDLFLNLMIEYAVKRANSGIYVPYRELPA